MSPRPPSSSVAALLLAGLSIAGCTPTAQHVDASATLIGERQALEISRNVAQAQGYDLARYQLDTFGDRGGGSDKEWLFVYVCKPVPSPPGCSFMVVVDRTSGKATIHPGQ